MHSFLESSNELLRKRGYRLTPQRHMILSVIEEAGEHLSVEQIIERVQLRNPYVSQSTVYRTIELLKGLELIREYHLPGGPQHYEAVNGHAHHHLTCRHCHTTLHLDESLLGNLHELLQAKYHFYQLTLDLMALGYCEECWSLLQNQANQKPETHTCEKEEQK